MTNELSTILIGAAVFAGRLWSAWEHKKTGDKINIYMNGEFEKRLEQEKEKWKQEFLNDKT